MAAPVANAWVIPELVKTDIPILSALNRLARPLLITNYECIRLANVDRADALVVLGARTLRSAFIDSLKPVLFPEQNEEPGEAPIAAPAGNQNENVAPQGPAAQSKQLAGTAKEPSSGEIRPNPPPPALKGLASPESTNGEEPLSTELALIQQQQALERYAAVKGAVPTVQPVGPRSTVGREYIPINFNTQQVVPFYIHDPVLRKIDELRREISSKPRADILFFIDQVPHDPFPDSVWYNIACLRYVNLAKCLDANVAAAHDTASERIGSFLITTDARPKVPISSFEVWTLAWRKYSHAVEQVYPIIRDYNILRIYEDHIMELSQSYGREAWPAIYAYDCDRRNKAVAHRDYNLSQPDPPCLNKHLREAQSRNAGGPNRDKQSTNNRSGPIRAGEKCNNWNDGRCAEPCTNKRTHACTICGGNHRRINHRNRNADAAPTAAPVAH